jgi:glycosyltransferase involved in cell wall biosynthesis
VAILGHPDQLSRSSETMSPKGRLLFINRVFPPDSGASGLRLLELCQGLAEKNWQISVLTNKGRGTEPANLHPNIKVIRLKHGTSKKPAFWHYPFWLYALTFRALMLPKHDIVITLTDPPMSAMISAKVKFFRRCKAVHWVHDLYPDLLPVMGIRLPVLQPVLMAIARLALKMNDKIVAIGDDMKTVLIKDKVPPEKISVIPNWPDVKSAMMDKRKPNRADSENPFILENSFTVLYSGNFGLVHDFDALIDAIKIVQQSQYPIRFIFAGDGLKFDAVRERVESMLLTNTHFVRAQPKDKFIDMLLAGDLHVASMIPEATGMVAPSKINSALGLSRPCLFIGSKDCMQGKLINEYQAGKVIDPYDPQAKFKIAEAIIQYAAEPAVFEQAKLNALRAADSISFDKALLKFDTLLSELIAS